MRVLCNTMKRVAYDSKCYEDVELDGENYWCFTAEFSLSSYGWSQLKNSNRISIPYYVDRNTDLSRYKNVVGLVKILDRLKALCIKGHILKSEGSILVYCVSPSKYYLSVIYTNTVSAF